MVKGANILNESKYWLSQKLYASATRMYMASGVICVIRCGKNILFLDECFGLRWREKKYLFFLYREDVRPIIIITNHMTCVPHM